MPARPALPFHGHPSAIVLLGAVLLSAVFLRAVLSSAAVLPARPATAEGA